MEIKDLAGLGEPITKLIERVADYIGVAQQPKQISREADARAYADVRSQLIKQSFDPNASEEDRVLARGLLADTQSTMRGQKNREAIVRKALPEVKEDAKPEEVEDDWFANFFDKSRLISDEEMQILWAKIFSGEVNKPGSFSKRTLNYLQTLSKKEALLVQRLISLSPCDLEKSHLMPLVYEDESSSFCQNQGINVHSLAELESAGLIVQSEFGYSRSYEPGKRLVVQYFDAFFFIYLSAGSESLHGPNTFMLGSVTLTDMGKEVGRLCSLERLDGFETYLTSKWEELGYKVTIQRPAQPPQET